MALPPILDVFVVWHPDDPLGEVVLDWLTNHFHSPAFAGLAGGAVEVYGRSTGWDVPGSAPRPLGLDGSLVGVLPSAQFNAIVPVVSTPMARAYRDDPSWTAYIDYIRSAEGLKGVGVYPLRSPQSQIAGSGLDAALGSIQALPAGSVTSAGVLGRELSQAIAQRIGPSDGLTDRIRVFVSHTKHDSLEEADQDGPALFEAVRQVIAETRLAAFFDAQDLQSGSDWERELDANAENCALLMVRTDKYSSREWTQREVLAAKRHDVPIVGMYALTVGEERGSFLMDHVPSLPCNVLQSHSDIEHALNRLVDEALKRVLWLAQTTYLQDDGFDWTPVHSPEPVTLVPWLGAHKVEQPDDCHLWIIHPDPPLGPKERDVVIELCSLAGFNENVDVLTPRTFAARGGRLHK
ncbi:toll/interleukin-1 receptor domain-containing protein [Mycolicibacterium vinylchloridicum]|uniref:toll/interleukin-1 receptor domain-containing protein n=1 Tax=Mycolicibacterium vinylchloridicum TaxID=2736928 RepID=UPI0015CCB58E|nr:toll/interleukin-1 receptor domain-containing protein [Mycolicibacterium vinylchloridicum]